MFISWDNGEIFAVPPASRDSIFFRFSTSRLATMPRAYLKFCLRCYSHTVPAYSRIAEMTRRVRKITPGRKCVDDDVLYVCSLFERLCFPFFGLVQFVHQRGGISVPLTTGVMKIVEVISFYELIRLAAYDPGLCLLAVRRFQVIDW